MGPAEQRIKELIKERFGGVPKFAQAIDVPKQTIYSALESGFSGSSLATVMPVAKELGLDPIQLLNGKAVIIDPNKQWVDVPLFGAISAGRPDEPQTIDDSYPIPAQLHAEYPSAFLLKVDGESMNRVLPNGCYALVDPCSRIDAPGKPYAVVVGDLDATVKCARQLDNGIELSPSSLDPTFKPTIYDFGEPDSPTITVIGRVVWYCLPPSATIG